MLFHRIIELHVSRNHDLFHPMAVAMEIDESGKTRQHPINAHQFYIGQISDDTTSRVKLHVTPNGILTASITTENDVIYIEVCNYPNTLCIYKYHSASQPILE